MSNRAHLQGQGQKRAAQIYASHEGKHVDDVAALLGVTRYTVTRASRTYGIRFAGIDVRKAKAPQAAPPRPQTRTVSVATPWSPGHSDRTVFVTLPKEPWA